MGGQLESTLLLLVRGADPNAKDRGEKTPWQRTCTGDGHILHGTSQKNLQVIQLFIDRWPVLMAIIILEHLEVFHWLDLLMMDLYEYIGKEKDMGTFARKIF